VTDLGLKARAESVLVQDADDAERLRFLGSPTVHVNGVDIEPEARTRTNYAFGCRIYGSTGIPSRALLQAALRESRAINDTATVRGEEVCPECRREGRRVKRVTLKSLLKPSAVGRIEDRAYRFCFTPRCETVYHSSDGSVFFKNDLTVRVGVKETTSPRPVCYCFDHTVEEIEAQVAATGESTVLDDIKTKLRDGCWCEMKNPQGACCLSVVSKCIADAKARLGFSRATNMQDNQHQDCCSPAAPASTEAGPVHAQRAGLWAAGASALSALLASACCWLPLLLLAFGVSAAGVSAMFEKVRPIFLAVCAALLGLGFYFVYLRGPACAPGTACATPNAKSQRRNRVVFWSATVAVVLFAFFPSYAGRLFGGKATASGSRFDEGAEWVVAIDGMTCEACSGHVRTALAQVPGVEDVTVSYKDRKATVRIDATMPPSVDALVRAVETAGYKATVQITTSMEKYHDGTS
jgi:copper chaperone CopZ